MRILALLPLIVSGACSFSPPLTHEERVTLDTCRADTDRIYNAQNRYQLSERGTLDAPFSTNGVTNDTTRGLADRYAYDQQVSQCVRRGSGGEAGSARDNAP